MPSFDIVSELDMMEVENAINMVVKEIGQRFDFRGSKSEVKLDKQAQKLTILADDDLKLRAIHQMIETKMAKRDLDLRCLKYGGEVEATGSMVRQTVELQSGISKEDAKTLTKTIKESKLKVQAQIQDEQVRVTGKKIDDLQEVMSVIKAKELAFPVQFVNMRR